MDSTTTQASAARRRGRRWLAFITASFVASAGVLVAPAATAATGWAASSPSNFVEVLGTDVGQTREFYATGGGELIGQGIRIPENSNVTIDVNGHTWTVSAAEGFAGIEVPGSSTLTLKNSAGADGGFTFVGGDGAAGIGSSIDDSGFGTAVGEVRIESGSVVATGSFGAAGIGGAFGADGGVVVISGGEVTATGGSFGAGIGGGQFGAGGSVTITSGAVTASSAHGGAGIGGGADSVSGGTLTISGTAVAGSSARAGISIADEAGVAASVVAAPAAGSFKVVSTSGPGGHVVISTGVAVHLDANGGTPVASPVLVVPGRTLDQPAVRASEGLVFADWRVDSVDGVAWDFSTPITGVVSLVARWVTPWQLLQERVAAGGGATITLDGDIVGVDGEGLALAAGATVTLDLAGHDLTIDASSSTRAGIAVPATSTLVITDSSAFRDGHLSVTGGQNAAGIGGAAGVASGAVRLEAGHLSASGGEGGAAIGAGRGSTSAGALTVKGIVFGAIPDKAGASTADAGLAASEIVEDASGKGAFTAKATAALAGTLEIVIGNQVTFNSNLAGGAGEAVTSPVFLSAGETIEGLPTPSRPGYRFVGWRVGSQSGAAWDEAVAVEENITLVARWLTSWMALAEAFDLAVEGTPSEFVLSEDIAVIGGSPLIVRAGTEVVLDLAGHDLTADFSATSGGQAAPGIRVVNGGKLTVRDSVGGGTLSAMGGEGAAGIGGGVGEVGGAVVIESGIVSALGGVGASSIGNGHGATGTPAGVEVRALAMPGTVTKAGGSTVTNGGAGAVIGDAEESTRAFTVTATDGTAGRVVITVGARVVFDSVGGTEIGSPVFVAPGAKLPAPSQVPTRDGDVFDTWYLGDAVWMFGQTVPANMVLTAGWLESFSAPSPTVSGEALVGSELTAELGTWTPAAPRVDIQWLRDGAAISGATSATYTLTEADLGAEISVRVRGWGEGFVDVILTSGVTDAVKRPLEATPVPYISGSAVIGETVEVQTGAWLPEATELSIAWFADGDEIVGQSGTKLAITSELWGRSIHVEVTGSLANYRSVTTTSAAVNVAPAGFAQVPDAVAISAPKVGVSTTVDAGDWSPAAEFSYQWLLDGVLIDGATQATYTPAGDQLGRALSVRVTGSAEGVASQTVGSVRLPIGAGQLQAPESISVQQALVDSVATIDLGAWTPAPAFTYQWMLDGEAIEDATTASFAVPSRAGGKDLSVRVTARAIGYEDVTLTSAPVRVQFRPFDAVPEQPELPTTVRVDLAVSMSLLTWEPTPDQVRIEWLVGDEVVSTDASFTPRPEDAAKQLVYRATATKDGYEDSVVESAPVTVTPKSFTQSPSTVTVTGEFTLGATVTADVSTSAWLPTPSELAIQWFRDGAAIEGATDATYTITSDDVDHQLHVGVAGVLLGYGAPTALSTPVVVAKAQFETVGTVVIDGAATVGEELRAQSSGWNPAPDALRYQWSVEGEAIEGADQQVFVPTEAQLSRSITVTVTAAKAGYEDAARTSGATDLVVRGWDARPGAIVLVSDGTEVRPGMTLTVPDLVWEPTPSMPVQYQWLRNGEALTGAIERSYTVTLDDVDAELSVQARAVADGRGVSIVRSTPLVVLKARFTTVGDVTITGEPKAGQTLTAVPGTWVPAPERFTYQWLRGGVAIEGATAETYQPAVEDRGQIITARVTPVHTRYASDPAEASVTILQVFTTAGVPSVTPAAPQVGAKLTVKAGTWEPAADAVQVEWLVAGKVVKSGADLTYTPVTADGGKALVARVTATKAGYEAVTVQTKSLTIQKLFTKAPVPTIKGSMIVGQTLTAVPGTWSPAAKFTFQWLRDGKAISKATKSTYKLVAADKGKKITVKVTGTATNTVAKSVVSKALGKVWDKAPAPKVTGTFKSGQTLKSSTGTWAPKAKFTYQWLRDGKAIAKATKSTYKLVAADKGKKISLQVKATASGYPTLTVVSAAKAVAK